MSFCRPSLFSVQTSKISLQQLSTRVRHAPRHTAARVNTTGNAIRFLGRVPSRDKPPHTALSPVALPSIHISERTMSKAHTRTLSMSEYEKMRARNPNAVAKLSNASYLNVFHGAVSAKRLELAKDVVLDLLTIYKGPKKKRDSVLKTIVLQHAALLSRETVLRVLEELKEASFPLGMVICTNDGTVAGYMLDNETRDTDRPFLRLFHPVIIERLSTMASPKKTIAATYKPSQLLYASFMAIHKLLAMSFHDHALEIFQILVEEGFVPSEALHNIDLSSGNSTLIISLALVRACIFWNWRALAASFMINLITTQPPDQAIIDLNIDTIYALLDTHSSPQDIRLCGRLIRHIHTLSPVPDSVIRLFYERSMGAQAKQEAEYLYAFTRSRIVFETHRYSPPQDLALPWLMHHLATTSAQTHLARSLATEAARDDLWIPASYRAQFIAEIAALGFARPARVLWERHVEGKDGSVVGGNSALMIRMVSLFWNVHKKSSDKAFALKHKTSEARDPKLEELEATSKHAAELVDRVRQTFMFHHAPLEKAQHWALTSLARSCFIVGKISEGFRTLRYLLDRAERPDIYDANVALSAVAHMDPRLGAKMIEKMSKLGLRPDSVTFATTLHYAVIQGDREVVDAMIKHIRNLSGDQVSVKTATGLIRAGLAFGEQVPDAAQQTLANILHLIKSFPALNMSSQTSLAKALVYAALRVKDGCLAFAFWKLLLSKAAQWDDEEQQRLRHAIAWHVRNSSLLDQKHKQDILIELKQTTATYEKGAPTK